MATITLSLESRERLPRVCIVCGESDCDFERVAIRPNVGAGGGVVLADRDGYTNVTLTLPLCPDHRSHFTFQTVLRYLAIAAAVGVCLLGMVLLSIFNKGWIIGITMAMVLVVAAYFVISMKGNKARVHISGYGGDQVEFSNVSSKFARAYKQRPSDDDEDRRSRQSRGRRRRDDD